MEFLIAILEREGSPFPFAIAPADFAPTNKIISIALELRALLKARKKCRPTVRSVLHFSNLRERIARGARVKVPVCKMLDGLSIALMCHVAAATENPMYYY